MSSIDNMLPDLHRLAWSQPRRAIAEQIALARRRSSRCCCSASAKARRPVADRADVPFILFAIPAGLPRRSISRAG